jgi:DNA repair exonuclease SbcCD ATPase subunit
MYNNYFNVITNVRRLLYEGILFVDDDLFDDLEKESQEKEQREKELKEKEKKEIKYEDKYLEEVRKMSNEYVFTVDEVKLTEKLYTEFYENALKEIQNSKQVLQSKLTEKQYELNDLRDMINDSSSSSSDDDVSEKTLIKEIDELNAELEVLNEKMVTKEEINEEVKKHVIEKRLDNLKNCFVIEKTPLGNVAMIYNNKKESFDYFSDSTIPYRYLEPVSRKYVLTFQCKSIYVDMEEELKEYERKLEEKEKEKKEKELMEIEERENKKNKLNFNPVPVKKNVFAKFKDYNKEAGSGRVNMVPPPKNSIPSGVKKEANPNEKVILKERANRYSCEGRFSNFSIIQKVDRKKVDKKFAMSFADFKKMNKK